MFRMRALALLFFIAIPLSAATRPKNVILLIADGAGLAHYTVTGFWRGADFQIGRIPLVGLSTTYCANRAVTDSAAGATALATGHKVAYEAVSQTAEGTALPTVLELARRSGKATGLVTTAYFYDATPSAFAAHVKHRGEYAEIIRQMLRSGTDVIFGAENDKTPEFRAQAKENGYDVVTSLAEIDASASARVLAVFREQPRDTDFPDAPLPELARRALERLRKDPEGFFVMIEQEGTDSGSHQNSIEDVRNALKSFDAAVGVALDFAAADGSTLVVVTSDHETGGLRLSETPSGKLRLEWSTTDHTATAVPVFATGPGADAFSGRFGDNTDVGKVLLKIVGGE